MRLAARFDMDNKKETDLLKNWKLKLAILAAIVVPTITATGAFYDLKAKIVEKEVAVNDRINSLELQNQKNFVDKDTVKEIRSDIKEMRSEITEIKNILIRRTR